MPNFKRGGDPFQTLGVGLKKLIFVFHPDDYHGAPEIDPGRKVYDESDLINFYLEAGYSAWSYRDEGDESWKVPEEMGDEDEGENYEDYDEDEDENDGNDSAMAEKYPKSFAKFWNEFGNSPIYKYVFSLSVLNSVDLEETKTFISELISEWVDSNYLGEPNYMKMLMSYVLKETPDIFRLTAISSIPQLESFMIFDGKLFHKKIFGTIKDLDKIEKQLYTPKGKIVEQFSPSRAKFVGKEKGLYQ